MTLADAGPLIALLDRRDAQHDPPFLLSVHKDYYPGVIGVDRYHYAPHGGAFNLYFEHPSIRVGTREFVVYNPRDEQVMNSRAMDLLDLTPARLELEWRRGHTPTPISSPRHWKCFWFD